MNIEKCRCVECELNAFLEDNMPTELKEELQKLCDYKKMYD